MLLREGECCREERFSSFVMMPHCPHSENRGNKYSSACSIAGRLPEETRLPDSLDAADLVPRVEVLHVEEVQQHLRHVFVLIDNFLKQRETQTTASQGRRRQTRQREQDISATETLKF